MLKMSVYLWVTVIWSLVCSVSAVFKELVTRPKQVPVSYNDEGLGSHIV